MTFSLRIAYLLFFGSVATLFAASQPPQRMRHHIDESETFRMTGQVRPAVALAQDLGAVADTKELSGLSIHFSLTAAQQADLKQLQAQLQDPGSKQFHKFLTPEEYGARFGLNTSDLEKITRWLEQSGFSNVQVARSRTWVQFSGTAGQAQAAFHAALRRYRYNGEEHFANATDPLLPKALQGVANAVLGLHDFHLKPNVQLRPQLNLASSKHALTPEDFATIYDLKPLYNEGLDGTGVKIAIISQSNVNLSDIESFRSAAGLSANDPQVILAGTDPGIQGDDATEADLDLEWAGAIAKNATVLLVVGNSNIGRGVGDALSYAIDHNVAPIVSISYGTCEANLTAAEFAANSAIFAQAAAQGMTLLASSGDSGSYGCDQTAPATHSLYVNFPADSQYITGVGGTMFAADVDNPSTYWALGDDANGGSALSYIGESAWSDQDASTTQLMASGGGLSLLEAKPSWQTGIGVWDGGRNVPDVAFSASPVHDPYVFCTGGGCVSGFVNATGQIHVAGGTSVSAPVMAGIAALLVQKTGQSQGNINPHLYQIAATSPGAFHDVTVGNNDVSCGAISPNCPNGVNGYLTHAGYDQATGWGSLDAANFLAVWPDFAISASSAAVTVPRNSSSTVNVAVSLVNGFTGNVSLACSVPASLTNVTCSIPANATAASAPLTITAGPAPAAQTIGTRFPPINLRSAWWAVTLLFSSSMFLFLASRPRRNLCFSAALTLLLFTSFSTISCGDGSSSGAKAPAVKSVPETGLVTVTAVSGEATKSVNVTVTVP